MTSSIASGSKPAGNNSTTQGTSRSPNQPSERQKTAHDPTSDVSTQAGLEQIKDQDDPNTSLQHSTVAGSSIFGPFSSTSAPSQQAGPASDVASFPATVRTDTDHADAPVEKEYPIRAIIGETKTCYIVDWEDGEDGTEYEPSPEPQSNVTQAAIVEWQKAKGKGDGSSSEVERVAQRLKVANKWFYKVHWKGNVGYKVTWEPEKHLSKSLVQSFTRDVARE